MRHIAINERGHGHSPPEIRVIQSQIAQQKVSVPYSYFKTIPHIQNSSLKIVSKMPSTCSYHSKTRMEVSPPTNYNELENGWNGLILLKSLVELWWSTVILNVPLQSSLLLLLIGNITLHIVAMRLIRRLGER